MDEGITRWINNLAGRHELLDAMMAAASRYGVPVLVAVVILQWWSKQDRLYVRHSCIAAGFSFLLGLG